ncbi:MAG TPA: redoxin domain-containing protein [Abditibacteriaceae bacterium]|jgi:peroxiredoxin Q/BCP
MKTKIFTALCALVLSLVMLRPAPANPEDFSVPSATTDKTFKLSEAKGKFVALHFLLKTECPFCLRHTREYFTKSEKLPNVVQVFLKPDSIEEIKSWAMKLPPEEVAKNPIYRDADASLAKEFKIPDGYNFHGQSVHYPALVLLNPEGKEAFRYVGKDNGDRFSFEKLQAKVAELSKVN